MQDLSVHEVHVWRVDVPSWSGAALATLAELISADEKERAARFVFSRDRDRFVLARGTLRMLLGHYLTIDPAVLCFVYNDYGKPMLADDSTLHFNLSHSGGLILYAFARNRRVGIDVEMIRAGVEIHQLARHVFSQNEQAVLAALPPDQQTEAFFNGWTCKEAYVKARGLGFSQSLRSFDVSLRPEEPAALLATRDDPEEAARWSLQALAVDAGYKAALAVEGHGWVLVDSGQLDTQGRMG